MIINKIILKNFQCYKKAEIYLDKINIITGINYDTDNHSSNGSGKSVLTNNAIEFCLYGEIPYLNLNDIIHKGENDASVTLYILNNKNNYIINRQIPHNLFIYHNNNEIIYNTMQLKQKYINEVFGDHTYYKRFRTVNVFEGSNILDYCKDNRSIITFRKIIMDIIENEYLDIRKNFLDIKQKFEEYHISKKPIKYYVSDKRKTVLNKSISDYRNKYQLLETILKNIEQKIIDYYSTIESNKKIINSMNKDIDLLQKNKKCPLCLSDILNTYDIILIKKQKISEINKSCQEINILLNKYKELHNYYKNLINEVQNKISKLSLLLMRLNDAEKYIHYKYTDNDIHNINESIKILDDFASIYINNWLLGLENIINNMLKSINVKIEFTNDNNFINIYDNNKKRKYAELSSGQKIFLSTIFKLAFLLYNNKSGLVIIDEGLQYLDYANLQKLLEIIQPLPFQVLLTYQNINNFNLDANYIILERKNGESKIVN